MSALAAPRRRTPRRTAGRRLTFIAVLLGWLAAGLPAFAGDTPPEAFGEVSFETPAGGAYPGEMITLVVRFFFKVRATTEQLEQPDLGGLGWTQLGRDSWAPTTIGSANWFGFTRRIAVFAPEAKTYVVRPFTHHVTLIDAAGVRWKVDATSKPVELPIRKWTGRTDGPDDVDAWWLPARSVTVTDSWTVDPGRLKAGETTRRRVEVTAVGVTAEQLPPTVEGQAPGLIVFGGPVERRTEIVDGVPVGHAVYAYDIRPHTGDPVILKEQLIPWFDTAARAMRQAVVPGASIGEGMVVPGQPVAEDAPAGPSRLIYGLGAGALAFVAGLGVLLAPGRRDREPATARLSRALAALRRTLAVRRAAWQGQPRALRAALYQLAREDGAAGTLWLCDPAVQASLAGLDAALFGRAAAADAAGMPALRGSAAAILRTRARLLAAQADLAGPAPAPASPFGY